MKLPLDTLAGIAYGCCEVRAEENGFLFDRMNGPLR